MKNIVVYLDSFQRYDFFSRLLYNANKVGYNTYYFTNKLSVYLYLKFKKINIEIIRAKTISDFQISLNNMDIANNILNINEASKLYINVYKYLETFNKNNSIDILLMWNGLRTYDSAITDYAKNNNTKTLYFELANIPGKVFIDKIGTNAASELFENIHILDKYNKIGEKEFEVWKKQYIDLKLNLNVVPQAKFVKSMNLYSLLDLIGYKLFNIPYNENTNLKSKIKDKYKNRILNIQYDDVDLENLDYIFFPLQVSNDSQVVLNSNISILDALKYSIKYAEKHGKKLIVKPHPAEPNVEYIKTIISIKNDTGFLLSNRNTFELIQKSTSVITINSTVGLESVILNKKTIFLGKSFYKNLQNKSYLRKYIMYYLEDIDYFEDDNISKEVLQKILDRVYD